MESYIVESFFEGTSYAALAGWLFLVTSLFFAFRRPAANVFSTLPFVGMGGAPLIAGYTYGRISTFVGLLTVLVLVLQRRQPGAVRFEALARTPLAWFAGVWLVISAKIVFETMFYGLDVSRKVNLVLGVVDIVFPSVVLLLSEMRAGPEPTAHDLLVGGATFPVLMMAVYLPFALDEGLLWSALSGLSRFTISIADTINSARVLAWGAIASLLLASLPRKRRTELAFAVFFTLLAGGFIVLILMTGTRQYLLGLLGFILLWAYGLQSAGIWRWLAGIVVFACVGIMLFNFVSTKNLALKERVSILALESEALDDTGRGAIWTRALESVLDHPMLGAGFKNFGEEYAGSDTQGNIVTLRDSAHGMVQDVFAEHGIPLGIAFLAGCIHLVVKSWQAMRRERRTTAEKALTIGLLALLLPLPFSSSFLSATPVYLLLIMAMARDGQSRPGSVAPEWGALPMSPKEH